MNTDDVHTSDGLDTGNGAEMPDKNKHSRDTTLNVMPGVAQPQGTAPDRRSAPRRELTVEEFVEGILAGDRVLLARAITLVESRLPEHSAKALAIIERVLPQTGKAVRVGITGMPGAGKSTFIEALGLHVIEQGARIAVLAIDPSSSISGGSIMGDKTRMEGLSADERAFIRPSPSAGSLGGVARKTREVMLLCEAAGYDAVFVETVGVGQSETMVHSMTDFFLLLTIPGAGDELQGIKRGIMELADAVVVNKADGDNLAAAQRAASDLRNALHLLQYPYPGWQPPALQCSAITGAGIAEAWDAVQRFRETMTANGTLERKRRAQSRDWMYDTIYNALRDRFAAHPEVAALLPELERAVSDGTLPPLAAANRLLKTFFGEDVQTL